MFNAPILNEMMARETIEYRARDLENVRRNKLARRTAPAERIKRQRTFARLVHAVRKPA